MSRIDSIEPDFKKSPSGKKINKPPDFKIKYPVNSKQQKNKEGSKKSLMFFLILLIMIIIVVGWLFLVKEGLIFTSNKGDNGWKKIKEGFGSITDVFKGDIFKKQENVNTNYANEEEQIKDLEKRLFPEFYNINNNVNNTQ